MYNISEISYFKKWYNAHDIKQPAPGVWHLLLDCCVSSMKRSLAGEKSQDFLYMNIKSPIAITCFWWILLKIEGSHQRGLLLMIVDVQFCLWIAPYPTCRDGQENDMQPLGSQSPCLCVAMPVIPFL